MIKPYFYGFIQMKYKQRSHCSSFESRNRFLHLFGLIVLLDQRAADKDAVSAGFFGSSGAVLSYFGRA